MPWHVLGKVRLMWKRPSSLCEETKERKNKARNKSCGVGWRFDRRMWRRRKIINHCPGHDCNNNNSVVFTSHWRRQQIREKNSSIKFIALPPTFAESLSRQDLDWFVNNNKHTYLGSTLWSSLLWCKLTRVLFLKVSSHAVTNRTTNPQVKKLTKQEDSFTRTTLKA